MTHAQELIRDATRELKEKFGAAETVEIRKTLRHAAQSIRERDRQLRSTPRLVKGFLVYEGGKQRPPVLPAIGMAS